MLMGEYQHTIDVKGRLFMPAKLRETLGGSFIISKGLDGCLFVYDKDEWHKLELKLNALPMTNKNARTFSRFFFSGAAEVECDKQGRVLLPVSLRTFAGLEKNAVIVGVGSRAEIWDAARWQEYNAVNAEDADTVAAQLADMDIGI